MTQPEALLRAERIKSVRASVTAEMVREMYDYDPATGRLTFRTCGPEITRRRPGDPAGTWALGKLMIRIQHVTFQGHRIIWLHHYGKWPEHQIDHINCDGTDNRIVNLRDVPHWMNYENRRKPQKNNTSGFLGVRKVGKGFEAYVTTKGKTHRRPGFATGEEAYAAYVQLKRQLHAGCTL